MLVLFLGITLLLAQIFFFSVGGLQDTVMLIIKWGKISMVLPYLVAAVLAGTFIYFSELPHRVRTQFPAVGFFWQACSFISLIYWCLTLEFHS